jgi:2-methylcitrate dehydratase PrpD
MTLSEQIGEFVTNLGFQDLPEIVVTNIKDRLLDTLGVCVAARGVDAGRAARGMAIEWGGHPTAALIGENVLLPAASAALVNGTYAHSLDFDDTHLPSIVHPSATLVPAVLAQAQAHQATGAELIVALSASYEILCRLAMAQYDPKSQNSIFFEKGLHATSILGTLAGSAGCAKLDGSASKKIADALGVACSLGGGIIESNRTGGSVKRFHCGWAAHGAIVASSLVAGGLTAPPTALEGRFGFFPAYCGQDWNPNAVLDELGTRWDAPSIFFKPYPCNHFTHALVDAAIALRERGLTARDVERVVIGTAAPSWRTIGDPIDQKRRPLSPYHAQFSGPFVFATALVGGGGLGVALEDFTDATLSDPLRLEVANRCDVVVDDECTRIFPHQFGGVVTVHTKTGASLTERVMVNRGGTDRPLSREDLRYKFQMNAGNSAAELSVAIDRLEDLDRIDQLLKATISISS